MCIKNLIFNFLTRDKVIAIIIHYEYGFIEVSGQIFVSMG
jgi:hypothetical protein